MKWKAELFINNNNLNSFPDAFVEGRTEEEALGLMKTYVLTMVEDKEYYIIKLTQMNEDNEENNDR